MKRLRSTVALDREIRFGAVRYDFHVRSGPDSWRELRRHLLGLDTDRFVIVADAGLPSIVVSETETTFGSVAPTTVLSTDARETQKSLATVDILAERAIRAGVTRRSCVVALGGGLAGNVAGLLAALIFRGIRLIHLPTTLLGMSDSVLSLKQAVNSRLGKNHLGVFAAPTLVWNNLDFLESLPADEIRSALCEMIKNVLAICPERYDEVAAMLRPDAHYSREAITGFIDLCVDAKTTVMRDDATEKRRALVLEYGHTIGHAAELGTKGALRHGFAIGVGMLAAARISAELGHLDASDQAAHRYLLARNGAPTALPEELDVPSIMNTIRLDNKRGYLPNAGGRFEFVLLAGLGRPMYTGDRPITRVDEDVVRVGVDSVLAGERAKVVA